MDYRSLADECLKNKNYKGYLENCRLKYQQTKKEEDLNEYNKAIKTLELNADIQKIISLEGQSPYIILDIDKETTVEDIKKRFNTLATKYHPTRAKLDGSNDAMRIIQKAYFQINTEEKKKDFDSSSQRRVNSKSDLEDLINNFARTNTVFTTHMPNRRQFHYSSFESPFVFNGNGFSPLYSNLYRNLNRRRNIQNSNPLYGYILIIVFILLFILGA